MTFFVLLTWFNFIFKKIQYNPPSSGNSLIYDFDTLRKKIVENERKILERKKTISHRIERTKLSENEEMSKEKKIIKKKGFFGSFGDFYLRSHVASPLTSIKLSKDLGKLNDFIKEGTASCRKQTAVKLNN